MASVNKVILIGNAGRDPEVRTFPNGDQVCNVSIATSRKWKDKTSGEKQEETEWHRLSFFGRLAEIAGEYIEKGKSIYVEGRLRTRKYTDKDGVERYATEVICDQLVLLGSKDDGGERGAKGSTSGGNNYSDAKSGKAPSAAKPKSSTGFDDMDDDIPF
jgi:single-strand DNA-binding protein